MSGSSYETITGLSVVPDHRGLYARGKNAARVDALAHPNGDLALGDEQGDAFDEHDHPVTDPAHTHTYQDAGQIGPNTYDGGSARGVNDVLRTTTAGTTGITVDNAGGNETRPKTITVNVFIKIN